MKATIWDRLATRNANRARLEVDVSALGSSSAAIHMALQLAESLLFLDQGMNPCADATTPVQVRGRGPRSRLNLI
jgi:hypothetical protein